MRKGLYCVLFFFACLLCQNAEAKVKQKPVYLFGFAISLVDSLGYLTDVQYIESSYVDTKTDFLVGRSMYSVQLQQYLQQTEGCKHPITSIFFGGKKEKMEKKLLSIRHRYEREREFTLKTVPYVFKPETYVEQEVTDSSVSDKADNKNNKEKKKSKKK